MDRTVVKFQERDCPTFASPARRASRHSESAFGAPELSRSMFYRMITRAHDSGNVTSVEFFWVLRSCGYGRTRRLIEEPRWCGGDLRCIVPVSSGACAPPKGTQRPRCYTGVLNMYWSVSSNASYPLPRSVLDTPGVPFFLPFPDCNAGGRTSGK